MEVDREEESSGVFPVSVSVCPCLWFSRFLGSFYWQRSTVLAGARIDVSPASQLSVSAGRASRRAGKNIDALFLTVSNHHGPTHAETLCTQGASAGTRDPRPPLSTGGGYKNTLICRCPDTTSSPG